MKKQVPTCFAIHMKKSFSLMHRLLFILNIDSWFCRTYCCKYRIFPNVFLGLANVKTIQIKLRWNACILLSNFDSFSNKLFRILSVGKFSQQVKWPKMMWINYTWYRSQSVKVVGWTPKITPIAFADWLPLQMGIENLAYGRRHQRLWILLVLTHPRTCVNPPSHLLA